MTNGGAASAGAAAAAAVAQAIKASGAIVRVKPKDFLVLLEKADSPLVVVSQSRFIRTSYQYLMGYKGLAFFTKSDKPLPLRNNVEVIVAKKIWVPT
jgi:hypothetical protein